MSMKLTIGVSFPGSVESPPQDVVVLVDSAGVVLGVQRAFSARVRSVRDGASGLIASRCVEIPLVGSDGEVSGILCYTGPRSDTCGSVAPRERERVRAIAIVARHYRRHGDRVHAVTQRWSIPHRQPSDSRADVVAGANTWRPVQRWSP